MTQLRPSDDTDPLPSEGVAVVTEVPGQLPLFTLSDSDVDELIACLVGALVCMRMPDDLLVQMFEG